MSKQTRLRQDEQKDTVDKNAIHLLNIFDSNDLTGTPPVLFTALEIRYVEDDVEHANGYEWQWPQRRRRGN